VFTRSLNGFGHWSNKVLLLRWGHSAIFKMATEDFPVLLAPSDNMLPLEVFDRKYLVEYPSREIWLYEAEAWLPSDGLKLYTSCLRARLVMEFFGRT
jgi:hypothetical protein